MQNVVIKEIFDGFNDYLNKEQELREVSGCWHSASSSRQVAPVWSGIAKPIIFYQFRKI